MPQTKVDCVRVPHPFAGRRQVLLPALPLDLHVLSLPLAFILSQDQTLHCKWIVQIRLFSKSPEGLMNLDVLCIIFLACSRYQAGLPAEPNFIGSCCCFCYFPNLSKNIDNWSRCDMQMISVFVNAMELNHYLRPWTAHLCYFFKNLTLLFCFLVSVRECKGMEFIPNHKIVFENYFFSTIFTSLHKKLYPTLFR